MWRDFCPLCGYRFEAVDTGTLCKLIIQHVDDGTCEMNFVSPLVALRDNGSGPGKGIYKPKQIKTV